MEWLVRHRMGILGFAVAAAYGPTMLAASFTPRWAVLAIGLPLASCLDPRELPKAMRWLLLALVGVAAASLLIAPDPRTGVLDLFYMVMLCGAFVAGAALDSLDDVMSGVCLGFLPSALLAVAQYFGFTPIPYSGWPAVGFFYHSEIMGEFSALICVWALLRPRWWTAAAAALPPLMCHSRIGVLAIAVGLIYALQTRSRRLATGLGLLALAGALLSIRYLGSDKMISAIDRIDLWQATIWSMTPLGHGLGWFEAGLPNKEFAHSEVLQSLAELGFIAIGLAAIPFQAFAGKRGTNAERALFAAVMVEVAVSFPLHLPAAGFLAAVTAGYLVSTRPALRLGSDHGRFENGRHFRRQAASGLPAFGRGRRLGGALPVRALSADPAPVHQGGNCPSPVAAAVGV